MKKSVLALLLSAFLCACASAPTSDRADKALALYKIGVSYLSEKKIQQAYVEFHKAYDLDPGNKEILNAIGYIYLIHFEDPKKSIEYFTKAVQRDPDFSDAYNNMGYAYEKMGNYTQAVTFYQRALSNPLYLTADKAYINLGNSYYRLRMYPEAISAYKESLKRDPQFFLPFMRLALCYNALGRYGEAATAITQGITLDPSYKGDKEKAVEDLTLRKLRATGLDEQDIRDYLEILKY